MDYQMMRFSRRKILCMWNLHRHSNRNAIIQQQYPYHHYLEWTYPKHNTTLITRNNTVVATTTNRNISKAAAAVTTDSIIIHRHFFHSCTILHQEKRKRRNVSNNANANASVPSTKKKNKFHRELDKFLNHDSTFGYDDDDDDRKKNSRICYEKKKEEDDDENYNESLLPKGILKNKKEHLSLDSCWKGYDLFASCLPGFEDLLERELLERGDGILYTRKERNGVSFGVSTMKDLLECHLYLGCASHILLRCHHYSSSTTTTTTDEQQQQQQIMKFRARGYPELTRKISSFPPSVSFWKRYFVLLNDDDENLQQQKQQQLPPFDIRVSTYKSKLFHTKGIANAVRLGIQNIWNKHIILHHHRTDDDDDDEESHLEDDDDSKVVKMLVRIVRDEVEISIDTSQTPLHRRGYRLETAKAPLREDIAYALLYASTTSTSSSRNDDTSHWNIIMDPFCGAGTIAIEAAAMALNLPPGRLRPPPFQPSSRFYAPHLWNQLLLQHPIPTRSSSSSRTIVVQASDIDAGAVQATINNAKRAGVLSYMNIYQSSFPSSILSSSSSSDNHFRRIIVTNPPYGKRISKLKEGSKKDTNFLLPLYQSIYNHARTQNISVSMLSNDLHLIRSSGFDTNNKNNTKIQFVTKHGGMKVFGITLAATTTTTNDDDDDDDVQSL